VTRLVVDLDQLAAAVQRMERFQEHLVRTHDEVERRVRDMHIAWTGEAAAAQSVAQQHWTAASHEVQDALAALRSIASTAHANYTAAASANQRMWSA
jgi:WXG100 family type VII secretion target